MNSPTEIINTAHMFSVYLFCMDFFSFFLIKEPHLEKKKLMKLEWNRELLPIFKNFKRKLIHSITTKLHMGSGLIKGTDGK